MVTAIVETVNCSNHQWTRMYTNKGEEFLAADFADFRGLEAAGFYVLL